MMDTSLLPQIVLRPGNPPQAELDLATEGVLRYVWHSAWGDMLIEVKDGAAYVNGQPVQASSTASRP